jgi:hypothetical protein
MNFIESITQIETVVGQKLADVSQITPLEERECFALITDFLKKITPLAAGTFSIGDVTSSDNIRTVNIPFNLITSDYRVVGSLVSKGANWDNDNDVIAMIRDRTVNSFKICLREVSGRIQDLDFEWIIYRKN